VLSTSTAIFGGASTPVSPPTPPMLEKALIAEALFTIFCTGNIKSHACLIWLKTMNYDYHVYLMHFISESSVSSAII